jgi:hypothetical protein
MRRCLILISFLICFSSGFTKIIEINELKQAEKHIDRETLVIFDLDNTLMETSQTLGSNQWFEHRIDYYYVKKGQEHQNALEIALQE